MRKRERYHRKDLDEGKETYVYKGNQERSFERKDGFSKHHRSHFTKIQGFVSESRERSLYLETIVPSLFSHSKRKVASSCATFLYFF